MFDRHSGIDLVDAVAASTGNGYPIGDRRYINGGYRRSENADLAMGFARVVVLSPFGGRTRMPLEWRMDLASQVADLRAGGSRVETVFPEAGAGEVFDANALDPATRLPAARGGHEQGLALAEHLAGFGTDVRARVLRLASRANPAASRSSRPRNSGDSRDYVGIASVMCRLETSVKSLSWCGTFSSSFPGAALAGTLLQAEDAVSEIRETYFHEATSFSSRRMFRAGT